MVGVQKKLRRKKGITLIALVVTIVVLLILAGITINILFSNGGIFKIAQDASKKWKEAEKNDINSFTNLADKINELVKSKGDITETETGDEYFIWQLNDDNTTYSIIGLTEAGKQLSVINFPNFHEGLPVTNLDFTMVGALVKEKETGTTQDKLYEQAITESGNNILTKVVIPENVETIKEAAFTACIALEEFEVSPDNKNFKSIDGVLFNKTATTMYQYPYNKKSTTYQIPDSVEKLNHDAVYKATNYIENLIMNDKITTLSTWELSNCKTITIGKGFTEESTLDRDSIENIYTKDTVNNYTSQSGILYSNDMTRLVKIPNNYNIRNYSLPLTVNTIGTYAYKGVNISTLTLPANVISIENRAFANSNITEIVINGDNCNIGPYCFSNSKLENATINGENCILNKYSFNTPTIVSLTVGQGATLCNKMISAGTNDYAFTELNLLGPIKKIENETFGWCKNFTTINGPIEETEIIEDEAFVSCSLSGEIQNKILSVNPNGISNFSTTAGAFYIPSATLNHYHSYTD